MIYWKYDIDRDECYIKFKTEINQNIFAYCCYGNSFYITCSNRFLDVNTLEKNKLLNISKYFLNKLL